MKGFAISSEVAEAPITEAMAVALTKAMRRLEAWWSAELANDTTWKGIANVEVKWSPDVGAMLPDLEFCVVHVVGDLPDAPKGVIAYHTRDALERPVCLISWNAVKAEGGTLTGPDGLTSAIAHEMLEARIDGTCTAVVDLPGGQKTPKEVCDWVQGTDYEEPDSPGVFVANAVGPRFFKAGETGRLDTRSDLTDGAVTRAFEETPGGYHEVIADDGTTSDVFGEKVTEAKRARVIAHGPRGGLSRQAKARKEAA